MSRQALMVLACVVPACRWRSTGRGRDPDPTHVDLEMVAWCHHCDREMFPFRTQRYGPTHERHWYQCPTCRRMRADARPVAQP